MEIVVALLIGGLKHQGLTVSDLTSSIWSCRILAEKLAGIIQMRIVQIQRNKVGQDHQILLACKGAPRVDGHGRRLPAAETAGDTFFHRFAAFAADQLPRPSR